MRVPLRLLLYQVLPGAGCGRAEAGPCLVGQDEPTALKDVHPMRQPHLRAQQAGPVDRPGEVQAVWWVWGCDLLQPRVLRRPLP